MEYIVDKNGILLEIDLKVKNVNDNIVDRLIYCWKKSNMTQQDVADATGIKKFKSVQEYWAKVASNKKKICRFILFICI